MRRQYAEPPARGQNVSLMKPLLLSLQRRDEVSEEERALLENLPATSRSYRKNEEIVSEHSEPTESCLITRGFAGRSVYVESGKRQLTAVHITGDFVDLHGMLLKVMDHSVVALSECDVVFVPHRAIVELMNRSPHLGRLLWLLTVVDGAIQRAWMAGLGRRSPIGHLSHLICELYTRLEIVGLAGNNVLELPLTQGEIADLLGLSIVHVNRTIQDLRSTGVVSWRGGTITIVDQARLTALADFDPTYLNLRKQPR